MDVFVRATLFFSLLPLIRNSFSLRRDFFLLPASRISHLVTFVYIAMVILAMRECVYFHNINRLMFFSYSQTFFPYILSILGFAFLFFLHHAQIVMLFTSNSTDWIWMLNFCHMLLLLLVCSFCAISKCSSCFRASSYQILFLLLPDTRQCLFFGYQ